MESVFEGVWNEEKEAEKEEQKEVKKFRRPFCIWEVGGEEIKLKLPVEEQMKLESKYKTALLNLATGDQGGLPPVTVMLDITQAAAKKFNHGINKETIVALYNRYIDEGGSMTDFYTDVFMGIYEASGFFSKQEAEKMKETKENLMNQ